MAENAQLLTRAAVLRWFGVSLFLNLIFSRLDGNRGKASPGLHGCITARCWDTTMGTKTGVKAHCGGLLAPALGHGPRRSASPAGAGTVAQICHSAWLPWLSLGPGAGRQGARSVPRAAAH